MSESLSLLPRPYQNHRVPLLDGHSSCLDSLHQQCEILREFISLLDAGEYAANEDGWKFIHEMLRDSTRRSLAISANARGNEFEKVGLELGLLLHDLELRTPVVKKSN